jgi:hypothetical protein
VRQSARYYLLLSEGEEVGLRLEARRMGRSPDMPAYILLDVHGEPLAQGELEPGRTIDLTVTARLSGVHVLHVNPGAHVFSVATTARHWAIAVPTSGLPLCGFAAPLHFYVPSGVERFTVRIRGTNELEGVLLTVLDPDGNVVAEQDTDRGKGFTLPVNAPEQQRGKVWSVVVAPPRQGVFEDATISWEGVPPYVTERPGALLVPRP